MDEVKSKQPRFGTGAYLLVLVVVIILAIIGYVAFKGSSKNTANTQTAVKSAPSGGQEPGKKMFCDSVHNACFYYPTNWSITSNKEPLSDTNTLVTAALQSPNKTVNVSYTYPYTKDGDTQAFLTMSIDDIPGQPDQKLVGGIYTGNNNFAQYAVVSATAVANAGLAVGQTSQFVNTPRFTLGIKGDTQLAAIDAANGPGQTLDAAKAWFSSDEAKAGKAILQSFTAE